MHLSGIFAVGGCHFSAAGGGAKIRQSRTGTDAYVFAADRVTIGPLTGLPESSVPTACSLLSKNV